MRAEQDVSRQLGGREARREKGTHMLGTVVRFALATAAGLVLGVVGTRLAESYRDTGRLFV